LRQSAASNRIGTPFAFCTAAYDKTPSLLPMQTYRCTCGNRLFFENTQCVVCQREVGWCECCRRVAALEPLGEQRYRCNNPACGATLHKCHNYAVENICNRLFSASDDATGCADATPKAQFVSVVDHTPAADAVAPASAETATPPEERRLCAACRLTETIPDLAAPGHREKWARLEAAKRRLLYTLDRLGVPYAEPELPLSFDFKADVEPPADEWRDAGPAEVVYTGHANGKITINIREADDAEREKLRVTFGEAHRTLIGHFHHEVGHYYWQLLVDGRRDRIRECLRLFGDHNHPPYAEAMAAYYQSGPREDWPGEFISPYASAHPWEDFAETFALYLDMVAVLDTASHLFKSIKANFRSRSVKPLVERYQEIGILENEFNRTMGLIDLVPEVIVAPVVEKLEFIHKLVKSAARPRRAKRPAADVENEAAVPMLMQQSTPRPTFMEFEPAIIVNESA
jgi:hypothetical protein